MKVNIKIYFDDDEKLLFKNLPDGMLDDVVKIAREKAFNSIHQELLDFISAAQLVEYLESKEGDFS